MASPIATTDPMMNKIRRDSTTIHSRMIDTTGNIIETVYSMKRRSRTKTYSIKYRACTS